MLTPPRLLDVPLTLTVRHAPGDAPPAPLMEGRALASLRPWLKPRDQADDAHGFLSLALQRAIPRPPAWRSFTLGLTYGYDAASLEEYLDPGDGYGDHDGPHGFKRPVLLLCSSAHAYVAIGEMLEHIRKEDAALAGWLLSLFNHLPFCESPPKWWRGVVGQAFWMGEADESLVREEQGDEFDGPTLARFHELVPAWVRTAPPKLSSTPVQSLRFCARAREHGLEVSAFFDAFGCWIKPRGLRALNIHHPTTPLYLVWKPNDLITQAIDEDKDIRMQSGWDTDAFAGVEAASIPRATAALDAVWRHLSALDAFIQSIRAYGRKHKLLTQ